METLAQENVVLSQNQPILPEQPKQNNFLVILLSILLLLSVSIAGFFAYQTQVLVKELTSMPVPIEESKDDPTADWKIYTNEKLSFKYPETWQQQLQQPEPILISLETDSKLRFFVTYHPSYSISEWLEDTQSGKIIGKKTIGSYTYTLIEGGLMQSSLEYLVENRGNGFVRFVVEPSSDKNEVEKVFDQILSTFKFVESDPTANWKKYLNSGALYQVKYPNKWRVVESATMVGFGPQEVGDDVKWTISTYKKDEFTQDMIKEDAGKQFPDRKQTFNLININGIEATQLVTTTDTISTWYLETIIIPYGSSNIVISNGAVKDPTFKYFYSTFTFQN